MVKIKPTDVKAVAAILNEPADDVNELAKRVIQEIIDRFESRSDFVVIVEYLAYGPYTTLKEAEKRIGNPLAASRPGVRGKLIPLRRDYEWSDTDDDELPLGIDPVRT